MRRAASRWADKARSVGGALLDVLAAELAELRQDLVRSGRELRGGIVLLVVAAAVAFWTVGLGLWLTVELLSLRLSTVQAAGSVFIAGLLAVVVLLALAKRRLGRVETPLHAVKKRGRDHAEWWQQNVLPELGGEGSGPRRAEEDDEVGTDSP